jgi:signal transduction histidine kinase
MAELSGPSLEAAWFMTVQGPALTAVDANPACERAFGRAVQGCTLSSLLADGETELVDRARDAMQTGRPQALDELAVSTRAGGAAEKRRWALFLVPKAPGPDASPEVVIAGVDLTESLRARHWAEAVDDFLTRMAHDLRTPVTAILGWVRLLGDSGLTPEKRAHGLAVIDRNARRQVQLIERLLDPSQLPPVAGVTNRRAPSRTNGVHA